MRQLFKRTFSGKKVFITGHTGFKGAWLTLWMQMLGADVKGYSLPPYHHDLYSKIKKNLKVRSVLADIRDQKKLEKEILNFEPDFIFHLAAQSLVRKSYKDPLYTFETNITGTANLLYSILKLKKKCNVVVITTDKVYENMEWIYPYRETDRLGGYDPYSASKAGAEIVTDSMRNSFFNPAKYSKHKKAISTARAGNVIGGGDLAEDRLIPDIVKAISADKTIVIRNPDSVRPWQFVLEPLSGYMLLASKMNEEPVKFQRAYNFGPDPSDSLNVRSILDIALDIFGKGKYKIEKKKDQPHEAGLLRLDISKAREILKWNPTLDTIESVYKTIEWYKNSSGGMNAFELCVNDIREFENG